MWHVPETLTKPTQEPGRIFRKRARSLCTTETRAIERLCLFPPKFAIQASTQGSTQPNDTNVSSNNCAKLIAVRGFGVVVRCVVGKRKSMLKYMCLLQNQQFNCIESHAYIWVECVWSSSVHFGDKGLRGRQDVHWSISNRWGFYQQKQIKVIVLMTFKITHYEIMTLQTNMNYMSTWSVGKGPPPYSVLCLCFKHDGPLPRHFVQGLACYVSVATSKCMAEHLRFFIEARSTFVIRIFVCQFPGFAVV